jgi:hypothetical protein
METFMMDNGKRINDMVPQLYHFSYLISIYENKINQSILGKGKFTSNETGSYYEGNWKEGLKVIKL